MATLKDIAQNVGVSASAVSRVLNHDRTLSISEEKRQSIFDTAEALNYSTPRSRNSSEPRSTQKNPQLRTIAIAHSLTREQELANPYFVGIRLGIESRCDKLNLKPLLHYMTDGKHSLSSISKAPSIIAIGPHSTEQTLQLKSLGTPIIFIDAEKDDDEAFTVSCDLSLAMKKIIRTLQQSDYQKIGFIDSPPPNNKHYNSFSQQRYQAFKQHMSEANSFNKAWVKFSLDNSSGYNLCQEILSTSGELPDAIIAANDNIVMGIYRAIKEAGLEIGKDIGIIGVNDTPAAQFLEPPLSSISLPAQQLGEAAVDLSLESCLQEKVARKVTLATTLINRKSIKSN